MLGMRFPDYIWLTYSDEGGYSSQETAAYSDCESGEGLEGLFSLSSTTTSGSDSVSVMRKLCVSDVVIKFVVVVVVVVVVLEGGKGVYSNSNYFPQ